MRALLRFLFGLLIVTWLGGAAAQQLEIIELRSKTAAEVLPALEPLIEPGGTLSGMNNQLFLRASPRNREEIRRALAAIDKPARRLIIRVAQDRQIVDNDSGAAARGEVVLGSTRRSGGEVRVWDTRSQRAENATQMVQTVDGGRAFIQVGRALALPMRQMMLGPGGVVVHESVVYRDVSSGFYARPRLNGQRVTLEISQQEEHFEGRRGNVASQSLSTTVSGRLGEWIELGGVGRQAEGQRRGGFSTGTADMQDSRALWLMVEAIE